MKKDYYKILEIDRDASSSDIKKAYRRLSKKHHPDVSDNTDDKFKDISEAYSVLSDSNKKFNYDNYGSTSANSNPFDSNQRGFGFEDMFGGMGGFSFEDIFNSYNRSGNSRNSRNGGRPGGDIKVTIDLSLDEIEVGSSRKIRYKRKENCHSCGGKGGDDVETCMSCNGSGSRVTVSRTPIGIVQQQTICENCAGTGKIIINKCNSCNGRKYTEVNEELTIDIPIGSSDGILYKYENKGHSNQYGTGNLLVHFRVKPHVNFTKQNNNLISNIKLPFNILITGGQITIDGLNGKTIDVDIPPMTKPGFMIKLSEEGLPSYDDISIKGDVILHVDIDFPDNVNDNELNIISNLNGSTNFIYNKK